MVRQELDFFGLEEAVFGGKPWVYEASFACGPELRGPRCWCAAASCGAEVFVLGGLGDQDEVTNTTEVKDRLIPLPSTDRRRRDHDRPVGSLR